MESITNTNSSSDNDQGDNLSTDYYQNGCTPVFRVFTEEDLKPLHQIIYDNTRHLLSEHDESLSLVEKIRLPFETDPQQEDFSKLMHAVNDSEAFNDLITSQSAENAFKKVFGVENVNRFPVSVFRAQFPSLARSTYNWHQDEGTWYAVKVKDLAHKMPATLWTSVNGADETNSIEVMPDSHTGTLSNHQYVEGQGHFHAELPPHLAEAESIKVVAQAGEGIAFHPLTFHKSIIGTVRPRYSIDLRYYCDKDPDANYKVNFLFRLKRAFA